MGDEAAAKEACVAATRASRVVGASVHGRIDSEANKSVAASWEPWQDEGKLEPVRL